MKTFKKYIWPDGCTNNTESAETRPVLEFYLPDEISAEPTPAVIVCPGGGYDHLAAHEGGPYAELAVSCGMAAAVLKYRVRPHSFPAPYADACRAVRMLRSMADELNVNPDKIAIWGSSAGGHLACTVATQPELYADPADDLAATFSARPDGLILCYPVVTLSQDFAHTGSARSLLGEDATHAQRQQLSNELHVTPQNPPAFIFFTANDQAVPVENAFAFVRELRKVEVDFDLHVYNDGPHGMGLAQKHPRIGKWPELLKDWLAEWRQR